MSRQDAAGREVVLPEFLDLIQHAVERVWPTDRVRPIVSAGRIPLEDVLDEDRFRSILEERSLATYGTDVPPVLLEGAMKARRQWMHIVGWDDDAHPTFGT